jgi:hypothetical protein
MGWTDCLAAVTKVSADLRAHFEDCIVYHEKAIARYELAQERLVECGPALAHIGAMVAASIAHEETQLKRLNAAVQLL